MDNNALSTALSRAGVILIALLVFLFSIDLMGSSIGSIAGGLTYSISSITSNPFIGLFIGLLSTALLQSSSTTTSIAVAAVASGAIGLHNAIPIVLGANIGTTITSTIISMSYISKSKAFRRAVAAGTSHDFFNILTVLLLFPLEVNYRILERSSIYISSFFSTKGDFSEEHSFVLTSLMDSSIDFTISTLGAIISLIIGIALLFGCIKFISSWLYKILIGKTKDQFEQTVFKNKYVAFSWGLVITSLAQSSSLTTSLIVPLVATGKVKIKKAFQFIMGANIGTTITALLAATFQSEAAISLAIVHLLFNLIGVLLFFFIPFLSKIPVLLAKKLGRVTVKYRIVGFAYILLAFFLIPFTLIYISKSIENGKDNVEVIVED